MAPNGAKTKQAISEYRDENMSDNEPISTESRKVQGFGGGVYVNPTEFGRQMIGIEKGDEVSVKVYANGIWIESREK